MVEPEKRGDSKMLRGLYPYLRVLLCTLTELLIQPVSELCAVSEVTDDGSRMSVSR
jgi:hypothetical protein